MLRPIRPVGGLARLLAIALSASTLAFLAPAPARAAPPPAPGWLAATTPAGGVIYLSWSAVPGADYYEVFVGQGATGALRYFGQTGAPEDAVEGLLPRTDYRLAVRAVNADGFSAFGPTMSVTTSDSPPGGGSGSPGLVLATKKLVEGDRAVVVVEPDLAAAGDLYVNPGATYRSQGVYLAAPLLGSAVTGLIADFGGLTLRLPPAALWTTGLTPTAASGPVDAYATLTVKRLAGEELDAARADLPPGRIALTPFYDLRFGSVRGLETTRGTIFNRLVTATFALPADYARRNDIDRAGTAVYYYDPDRRSWVALFSRYAPDAVSVDLALPGRYALLTTGLGPRAVSTLDDLGAAPISPGVRYGAELASTLAYRDLDAAWSTPAVLRTGAMGILQGFGDAYFHPRAAVRRSEAIVSLARAAGAPPAPGYRGSVMALKPAVPAWATDGLASGLGAGIVTAGELRGVDWSASASREEVAAWAARAAGLSPRTGAEVQAIYAFDDWTEVGSDRLPLVEAALQEKLVAGTGDGGFHPGDRLTREQLAVLSDRLAARKLPELGYRSEVGRVFAVRVELDPGDGEPSGFGIQRTRIYLRNDTGEPRVVVAERRYDGETLRDAPVYKNGLVNTLGALAEGDQVRYLLNAAQEVALVEVLPRPEGRLYGTVQAIAGGWLNVSDAAGSHTRLRLPAGAGVTIFGRPTGIDSLLPGQPVAVTQAFGEAVRIDILQPASPPPPGGDARLPAPPATPARLSHLYRGRLLAVQDGGRVILGEASLWRGGTWVPADARVEVELAAAPALFVEGQAADAEALRQAVGETAYLAAVRDFGAERGVKLSAWPGQGRPAGSDILASNPVRREIWVTGEQQALEADGSTIALKDDRLVDPSDLDTGQPALLEIQVADGHPRAAVAAQQPAGPDGYDAYYGQLDGSPGGNIQLIYHHELQRDGWGPESGNPLTLAVDGRTLVIDSTSGTAIPVGADRLLLNRYSNRYNGSWLYALGEGGRALAVNLLSAPDSSYASQQLTVGEVVYLDPAATSAGIGLARTWSPLAHRWVPNLEPVPLSLNGALLAGSEGPLAGSDLHLGDLLWVLRNADRAVIVIRRRGGE